MVEDSNQKERLSNLESDNYDNIKIRNRSNNF